MPSCPPNCLAIHPTLLKIFGSEGRLVDVKFRFNKAKKEAGIRDFRFTPSVTPRQRGWLTAELMHSHWLKSSDGQMFEMALRYTHATDEAKRRAVESRVNPVGPSDESLTKKNARSQRCLKSLILLVEQGGVEPMTSALRFRRSAKT
jgi:hypothetical protein